MYQKKYYSRQYYADNPSDAKTMFRNYNKSKGLSQQYNIVDVERKSSGTYEVVYTQKRKPLQQGFVLRSLSGRRI